MITADRREREKAERKASILAAAQQVFFTKGFHNTTVDEVAERAQVSKGTVYLYFTSKEVILAHLLLDSLDRLVEDLECAAAPGDPLPADARVRRLADAYVGFFLTHHETYSLIMSIDRGLTANNVPEAIYAQVLTRSLYGFNLLVQAIEQGVAEGRFATAIPRETAAALWAAINGVLALLAHPLRQELIGVDLERLYQVVLSISLQGLCRGDDGQTAHESG